MGELQPIYFPEAREIQSECGLAAIYLTGEGLKAGLDVRRTLYQMGMDVQHRAQGSAGMYITNGIDSDKRRDFGWVSAAFKEGKNFPEVDNPTIGIIHTRYPTSGGSNHRQNIQPFSLDGISFAHHGNLTNVDEIQSKFGPFPKGGDFPDSDSWIAINALLKAEGNSLGEKLVNAQREFWGGWAFIATDQTSLVASRDPYGTRPLMLGYVGPVESPLGYALAVETCAFEKIPGFREFRDIRPGETVQIDTKGETVLEIASKGRKHCSFEFVYMGWPSSIFEGRETLMTRERMGQILAKEAPPLDSHGEDIFIVPVPDSSRPAARTYYDEVQKTWGTKAHYEEALLKNKYVGRNYIEASDKRKNVQLKYTPVRRLIEGRIIYLVDDSIVRADTSAALVDMLRSYGAKEVHLRIVSPPIKNACYSGVDQSGTLIAKAIPDIPSIARYLNADSLAYLSKAGLAKAIGIDINDLCMYCFDGDGPPLPTSLIPLQEA